MKKILHILLFAFLAFALYSCSKSDNLETDSVATNFGTDSSYNHWGEGWQDVEF